jgi:hypothetical protein
MAVIFDNSVVFHKGFGVDDSVSAHTCASIDQCMGNLGMMGYYMPRGIESLETARPSPVSH